MRLDMNRLNRFLEKHGLDANNIDMAADCERFSSAMEQGLHSAGSQLLMLPTYIGTTADIPAGRPVIALDMGGTRLRVAVVRFSGGGQPVIEHFSECPAPGVKEEITKEAFFSFIADYLEPLLPFSDVISFCFSFGIDHLSGKDGRVLALGKELKISGLTGQTLGGSLNAQLVSRGISPKKIIVINDAPATLLAGTVVRPGSDCHIGFILGTGVNASYVEKNENIKKLPSLDPSGSMVINIESGGFNGFEQSDIDRAYNASTINPGFCTFEKIVSGRYLGGLALEALRAAAREGLFEGDEAVTQRLEAAREITAGDIDAFLDDLHASSLISCLCCNHPSNCKTAYTILRAIIKRAAKLVAINLAAVLIHTGMGKCQENPVCVTVEGSVFHKSKSFRYFFLHYVESFINQENKLFCEFVKVENATLIGTAAGGLTN